MARCDATTLGEIARWVGGQLHGPEDHPVARPVPADSDDPEGLAFVSSKGFLEVFERSGAGAALVPEDLRPSSKPHIVVKDPRAAFGAVLVRFDRPLPLNPGVHPTAIVAEDARVSPTAQIGPYAVVEAGAKIGPGVRVYPFAYVGEGCQLGEGTTVYPHAVLYRDVRTGRGCVVHAGAVLGADGFGFVWDGHRRVKVPQVGRVVLGDEVEIGANTAVDRATAGETVVGSGSKLDNLVQIGHNVRIGEHTVAAAQVGVSGSTTIGSRVTIAGQVAFSDHVEVCDDVVLGGRSAVIQNIREPGEYLGFPARPLGEAMRALAVSAKLPELAARLRRLEERVRDLESE
ncbi:MAG: UDP-3-O-(3-hydroxymyristoyl)glucosamine N-acyltransferase [Fimbriimonadales bacterium]|nr:UDP-3-O-(3-hydroxymyristoyl)glucosamine N-acyltransferase [Fimbriimonadales bacterium]